MTTIYTSEFESFQTLGGLLGVGFVPFAKLQAEEKSPGSWTISSSSNIDRSQPPEVNKLAKNLTTNQMCDYLLLIEQKRLEGKRTLDIDDLAEENEDPNYIVNFYKKQVSSGVYEPTLLISHELYKPRKTSHASQTIEIKDIDMLTQIKEDAKTDEEKVAADVNLAHIVAIKDADDTWQMQTLNTAGSTVHVVKSHLTQQEARDYIKQIERLKGCERSADYVPHCHPSKAPTTKPIIQPTNSEQFSDFRYQEIEAKNNTKFKLGLN